MKVTDEASRAGLASFHKISIKWQWDTPQRDSQIASLLQSINKLSVHLLMLNLRTPQGPIHFPLILIEILPWLQWELDQTWRPSSMSSTWDDPCGCMLQSMDSTQVQWFTCTRTYCRTRVHELKLLLICCYTAVWFSGLTNLVTRKAS